MNTPILTSARRSSVTTPAMTTVAGYLLTRLTEAGVISVFGVPGDYNLGILDAITGRPSMAWVGMATEQGAGYAADSYARLRGLGALVTTFGVGELSAINAIAGAYAESVPVVHIVGTPALRARLAGETLHHNLPGTDFGHYARMAAEVTEAQADLRASTAPAEIDRVLRAALRTSRPVYLAIPADVAGAPVPAPAGPLVAAGQESTAAQAVAHAAAAFGRHARRVLGAASSASLLVGHLASRHGVTAQVRELAAAGDLPVAVLSMAKGDFPESDPRFMGLYAGAASAKRARLAVEDTDVLITIGVTLADTVTGGGTHQLPEDHHRIDLAPGQARIGGAVYGGIDLRQALAVLTQAVRVSQVPARADLADAAEAWPAATAPADRAAPLTQQHLWSAVQEFLLPGDLVIADQGTAFYGAAGLTLPDGAKLIGQPLWASIGWTVPGALGASLAAPDRRVVLIAGDGAAQQTAPELGTLLAQGLAPVVIVLDNGGYAIERVIHSPSADYHHVPPWDWTKLPATVAKDTPVVARRAVTTRDLDAALLAADGAEGVPVLIEAVLGWVDAPPLLQDLARVLAVSDSYSS
jgi:indolepyruvate decarboxylase